MAEYTPTTEQVRAAFIAQEDFYARVASLEPPTSEESGEDFDRWLAEVRREAAEKAWDEVADYLDRTNAPSLAEAARRDNPYRKEADRG